jgi:oligopeptidase A
MSLDNNYLLHVKGIPDFSKIKVEDIKEAVVYQIEQCKVKVDSTIKQLEKTQDYTYDSLVAPIESEEHKLNSLWSPVSHLNSVMNSDELRVVHDECLPLLSDYDTYVGQHEGLFKAYKKLYESDGFTKLPSDKKKYIQNVMRDFRLSGIALNSEKKVKYGELVSRLAQLSSTFSNNVMDATLNWKKIVTDKNDLKGIPELALQSAKQLAEKNGNEGYEFTLDFPSYFPIIAYADNEELRKELYIAYVTRASDVGPNAGRWDNKKLIDEILDKRDQLAKLLGFNDYAQYSLETKMADSPKQVLDFLYDLAECCHQQGKCEFEELKEYARKEFGKNELNPWDVTYYSEKLKESRYNISSEELRVYFPLPKVLNGLFSVVNKLFGVKIIENTKSVNVWHKDVMFFDLYDENDNLKAGFFLDPYARAHKRGGAWMDECVGRMISADGTVQRPVAYLVCNFNSPVGDKPSLLTHDDVITLFHEFGHGLNLMLTTVDTSGVSGINGVSWDAVELPSQFLENWCWQPEALKFISSHVDTNEPLPEDKLNKLIEAKNYHSAMWVLRQLEFGLMDFRLHHEYDPNNKDFVNNIIQSVRDSVTVVPVSPFNRFEDSFTHIFSGGYAAGYYSYLWAELLSSDAFSRFEEDGIFNRKTGQDFVDYILSKGGSEEALDLFVKFRGRKPKIDALLRHKGIKKN